MSGGLRRLLSAVGANGTCLHQSEGIIKLKVNMNIKKKKIFFKQCFEYVLFSFNQSLVQSPLGCSLRQLKTHQSPLGANQKNHSKTL